MNWFKKIILVFLLAYLLNFIWECGQFFLYHGYDQFVSPFFLLGRASLWDACFITALYFFIGALLNDFSWVNQTRQFLNFLITAFLSISTAVLVEWQSLASGRWTYTLTMPLIPFVQTGLTPTLQLFVISLLVFGLVDLCFKNKISSFI